MFLLDISTAHILLWKRYALWFLVVSLFSVSADLFSNRMFSNPYNIAHCSYPTHTLQPRNRSLDLKQSDWQKFHGNKWSDFGLYCFVVLFDSNENLQQYPFCLICIPHFVLSTMRQILNLISCMLRSCTKVIFSKIVRCKRSATGSITIISFALFMFSRFPDSPYGIRTFRFCRALSVQYDLHAFHSLTHFTSTHQPLWTSYYSTILSCPEVQVFQEHDKNGQNADRRSHGVC